MLPYFFLGMADADPGAAVFRTWLMLGTGAIPEIWAGDTGGAAISMP